MEGEVFAGSATAQTIRALIDASVAAAKERHGDRMRTDAVVLVGYSNGAYALSALVHELAQRPETAMDLKGIVLFGADVHPNAADLHALGVRVGFTAGDGDGSAAPMRATAASLQKENIDARFVSLGHVGHVIPQSTSATIAALIDWARGG